MYLILIMLYLNTGVFDRSIKYILSQCLCATFFFNLCARFVAVRSDAGVFNLMHWFVAGPCLWDGWRWGRWFGWRRRAPSMLGMRGR